MNLGTVGFGGATQIRQKNRSEKQYLVGKNIALIFEKTSTRTRCAFEVAARDQGAGVTYLEPSGSQIGHKESTKDTARVLGRMFDAIEYRGFSQQKAMPDAPHEIMVVLDANIGQNAINQVVVFDDTLGITGLIVTKLDGTAKGGVLAALASNRPIPVRYIGVGEGIDDLRPFDARAFVDALLDEADS